MHMLPMPHVAAGTIFHRALVLSDVTMWPSPQVKADDNVTVGQVIANIESGEHLYQCHAHRFPVSKLKFSPMAGVLQAAVVMW